MHNLSTCHSVNLDIGLPLVRESLGRGVEILWREIGTVIVITFHTNKATLNRRLDPTQAASGVFITTRPVQLVPVLVVHPKLVVSEYQHRLARSGRKEKGLCKKTPCTL